MTFSCPYGCKYTMFNESDNNSLFIFFSVKVGGNFGEIRHLVMFRVKEGRLGMKGGINVLRDCF